MEKVSLSMSVDHGHKEVPVVVYLVDNGDCDPILGLEYEREEQVPGLAYPTDVFPSRDDWSILEFSLSEARTLRDLLDDLIGRAERSLPCEFDRDYSDEEIPF
jgi:hypothetical protein